MLAYRIPNVLPFTGRSKCPHCHAVLRSRYLVPIISYLFLRGRCGQCRSSISPQYLFIEIGSGLLFLLSFWHASNIFQAIVLAFALWLLLVITVIDFHTQGIPDLLSFPFIGTSIFYGYLVGHLHWYVFLVCTGFFALQWLVSWGRWVGSGDVLLSLGISGLLGRIDLALVMLCTAYISGALVALYLLHRKTKTGKDSLAFGPFLAIGTVTALFYGFDILQFLYYT